MTYRDEWGPWINHTGDDCPVPDGYHVEALAADSTHYEGMVDRSILMPDDVNIWDFRECYDCNMWTDRIVEYRIRTPRTLQEMKIQLGQMSGSFGNRVTGG